MMYDVKKNSGATRRVWRTEPGSFENWRHDYIASTRARESTRAILRRAHENGLKVLQTAQPKQIDGKR